MKLNIVGEYDEKYSKKAAGALLCGLVEGCN